METRPATLADAQNNFRWRADEMTSAKFIKTLSSESQVPELTPYKASCKNIQQRDTCMTCAFFPSRR